MSTYIKSRKAAAIKAAASPSTKPNTPRGIYTAHVCSSNADLIVEVARLYAQPGYKIADVTFGKGVFWQGVDLALYEFYPSDALTVAQHPYDFRVLPYGHNAFDIVVLDPPYRHNGGRWLSNNYQNERTTKSMNHDAIVANYEAGMREALRVLRYGGLLWVKTQDEISGSKQRRSTIEIYDIAMSLGFIDQDRFEYVQANAPTIQKLPQLHARKNSSSLWIFRKPRPNGTRQCERKPIPVPTVTTSCMVQTA